MRENTDQNNLEYGHFLLSNKNVCKSLQVKAEAYLEPKWASMMEFFVNIHNGLLFPQ